jgi:hypothetical protein
MPMADAKRWVPMILDRLVDEYRARVTDIRRVPIVVLSVDYAVEVLHVVHAQSQADRVVRVQDSIMSSSAASISPASTSRAAST